MKSNQPSTFPTCPENLEQLEDLLSTPTPGITRTLSQLQGDLLILGVGGKMGPSLARMARRACPDPRRRILGVSRFASGQIEGQLQAWGIETLRCNLLEKADLAKLPEAPNLIYMVGRKFGSAGQQSLTWATNTVLPAAVCDRYRQSRIVAFSTGNVYPFVPIGSGGSTESDPPNPVGEYGMSALGRERVFEYFSRSLALPVVLLRLNYACELRYGVLVDIALQVWQGQPVDLAMGYLNTLWQGDANAMALQAFGLVSVPPRLLNLTGLETLSVRHVAEQFGRLLNKPVRFQGAETATALLSNAQAAHALFDPVRVPAAQLIPWIAHWISHDGHTLNKPTHFQVRNGQF